MTVAKKSFVKSADTSSQVSSSKSELDRILRRYGATGLSVHQTFSDAGDALGVSVSFILPDSLAKDAQKVPVSIPIEVRRVYDALYERPTRYAQKENGLWDHIFYPKGYDSKKLAQAERVAWRNVVLWVDAALSAAAVGFQTITEAFFAHAVVQVDGRNTRMIEVIETLQGQLPVGVRALLATPADADIEQ